MKKSNLLILFILGTIPEILLALYLQDIWHTNFIETLIQIYLILIGLGALRFIVGEISFRLFLKKKMVNDLYHILVKERFPNPWNYYEEDGISYFDQVGRDVNNEILDARIINGATKIYMQVKTFYDLNQIGNYWRYKSILKLAVKRFMDKNFETSIDDLNLSAESLITTFEENLFWSPNELIFTNGLEYLEQVISKENAVANGKIEAIRIKHSIEQKMEQIRYSKSTYGIYSEEDERCLNMILENLNNAIKIYSER